MINQIKKETDKPEVIDRTQLFIQAQKNYLESGDKKYHDEMFLLVHQIMIGIFKKYQKSKQIYIDDLDGKILDATMDCISDIDIKSVPIFKIGGYAHIYFKRTLFDRKVIAREKWEKSFISFNDATMGEDIKEND